MFYMGGEYIVRKVYFVILLSFSLLLSACNEAVVHQSNHQADKEVRYAKLLTKDELNEQKEAKLEKKEKEGQQDKKKEIVHQRDINEVTDIVRRNLRNIEEKMPHHWDKVDGTLQLIDQMHLDRTKNDNKQQKELLKDAQSRLKDELTKEGLEELSRYFLITGHSSMHKDYVHVDDLHARYAVTNETETSFDFTFITVDDADAGFSIPGETTLSYEYDGNKWRLADLKQFFPNEKPLNITFDDLEEYYDRYTNGSLVFRPIEEEKINRVTYLTYQIEDRTLTRNAETSMVEYNN